MPRISLSDLPVATLALVAVNILGYVVMATISEDTHKMVLDVFSYRPVYLLNPLAPIKIMGFFVQQVPALADGGNGLSQADVLLGRDRLGLKQCRRQL